MPRRRRRIPSELVTAKIQSLSHEGRGITQIEGKTVFIHNALPGEQVSFKYTYCSRGHDEGRSTEILNASHYRTTPPCPHYDLCGGCQLQHMQMSQQLEHKQNVLLEQLQHFGKSTPESILPALTANELGYRRKARIGVRYIPKKERTLVGFRERNGRYIADLKQCSILHPTIGEKLYKLSHLIDRLSCYQHIPQIETAVGDHASAIIVRHMVPLTLEDKDLLIAFGKEHNIHIYCQPNKPNPVYKLHPYDQKMELSYFLPKFNIEMKFHPIDFVQVNQEINQLMINQAIDLLALKPDDKVLDLFCGIGNFSLPIARTAKSVVGVEGSEAAVARAKMNAELNGLNNTEFFEADLTQECQGQPWFNDSYNKILLDPARSGAEEIMRLIPKLGAKHIVYVSCNPATLARDAGILVNELGFTLKTAGIMNMFPHTAHVESVALFLKE